eukprot:3432875-Rhodomonas_salina.2
MPSVSTAFKPIFARKHSQAASQQKLTYDSVWWSGGLTSSRSPCGNFEITSDKTLAGAATMPDFVTLTPSLMRLSIPMDRSYPASASVLDLTSARRSTFKSTG